MHGWRRLACVFLRVCRLPYDSATCFFSTQMKLLLILYPLYSFPPFIYPRPSHLKQERPALHSSAHTLSDTFSPNPRSCKEQSQPEQFWYWTCLNMQGSCACTHGTFKAGLMLFFSEYPPLCEIKCGCSLRGTSLSALSLYLNANGPVLTSLEMASRAALHLILKAILFIFLCSGVCRNVTPNSI